MATQTMNNPTMAAPTGQPEGGQYVSPEQMAEHKEATEFAKAAQHSELKMRKANIILQSLSVGGDVVSPLFDEETRTLLQEKVADILKDL